jgi:hypothetical protein
MTAADRDMVVRVVVAGGAQLSNGIRESDAASHGTVVQLGHCTLII